MYSTTQQLWNNLGEDAYTKVRSEIVGTGNGTTGQWDFNKDNLISGSVVVYTDGSILTSSAYSLNLDDGKLTYTAGSNVVLTADYNYADIPDSWVASIIDQADDYIDKVTGLSFNSTSAEVEYIDVEEGQKIFWTKYYPIINLTSVEQNIASSVTDTPNWSTSVEGLGNDYIATDRDKQIGQIKFIDNFPLAGIDRLRITYDWGYTTTPNLINELSILLATKRMVDSSIYRSIIKGRDNFTPTRLDEINQRIIEITNLFRKQNISKI